MLILNPITRTVGVVVWSRGVLLGPSCSDRGFQIAVIVKYSLRHETAVYCWVVVKPVVNSPPVLLCDNLHRQAYPGGWSILLPTLKPHLPDPTFIRIADGHADGLYRLVVNVHCGKSMQIAAWEFFARSHRARPAWRLLLGSLRRMAD